MSQALLKNHLFRLLTLSAALLAGGAVHSQAQIITSAGSVNDPNGTVEVGSPTDYEYVNVNGTNSNLTDLTNFNVIAPNNHYQSTAAATAPDGTTLISGDDYVQGSSTDTADGETQHGVLYFSLKPSSTETNFYVYVLVNNVANYNGFNTSEVTLTSDNGSGLPGSVVSDPQSFTAANPDSGPNTIPTYVEFKVTGATSADNFSVTTSDDSGNQAVGALTFQVAPEPSTYAMILGGIAFLVLLVRRKSARFTS